MWFLSTSGEEQKPGVSLLIDPSEILMKTSVEIVPYSSWRAQGEDLGKSSEEKQNKTANRKVF